MAKRAYQDGTGEAPVLRSTGPAITMRTQRVRLTLAVADVVADAPIGETITHPRTAAMVARAVIGEEPGECVLAIFLNARNRVTGYAEVARGTVNAARLQPREVLIPALLANAHSVVVAHNHPSGEAAPSYADRSMTALLRDAMRTVGVPLTDHVIVTARDHYSFAAEAEWSVTSPEGR
jgi:DNA repair protein RadC